eukprot:2841905-Pleurochrysis_carterae.AAC.3
MGNAYTTSHGYHQSQGHSNHDGLRGANANGGGYNGGYNSGYNGVSNSGYNGGYNGGSGAHAGRQTLGPLRQSMLNTGGETGSGAQTRKGLASTLTLHELMGADGRYASLCVRV